jgi:hypothetical protein
MIVLQWQCAIDRLRRSRDFGQLRGSRERSRDCALGLPSFGAPCILQTKQVAPFQETATQNFGDNIVIDGGTNGTAYEQTTLSILTQLLGFRTGNALIKEIWSINERGARISPWTDAQVNADVNPVSWSDGTLGMEPIRRSNGQAVGGFGSGRGSDALVRFSPHNWQDSCSYRGTGGQTTNLGPVVAPGVDRNSVLLHELVHAVRFMRGVFRRRAIPIARPGNFGNVPASFGDEEELIAVVVTNIYASERGLPLRQEHSASTTPLSNMHFWREPTITGVLREFMRASPRLAAAMAAIQTDFNPIREIAHGAQAMLRLRNWDGHVVDPYSRQR